MMITSFPNILNCEEHHLINKELTSYKTLSLC